MERGIYEWWELQALSVCTGEEEKRTHKDERENLM